MAEYADEVELNIQDMEKLFDAATEYVRTVGSLSDENKLYFYALYKQVKEGPCCTSRPGFWDFVGRAKWDSWKKLGDMPRNEALELYIQKLFETDPEWEAKYAITDNLSPKSVDEKVPQKQSMGVSVSTLRRNDDDNDVISDGNKSIFDWCKEGNLNKIDVLLTKGEQINSKDEQGMMLLHWACDRGHDDIVKFLLEGKADVNSQMNLSQMAATRLIKDSMRQKMDKDADGQTPLHYAATCDFASIVKQLLQSGADGSIADSDGCLPADVAESKAVKELLLNEKIQKKYL